MEELIKALTKLTIVAADYLEKHRDNAQLPLPLVAKTKAITDPAPAVEVMGGVKPKRTRRTKVEMQVASVSSVEVTPPAAPKVEPPAPMSEAEAVKAAREAGAAVLLRFAKTADPKAVDRLGNPIVEGFHMVKKLLADEYKVGRLADLKHDQRISFVARCREMVNAADKQPENAVKETVGVGL